MNIALLPEENIIIRSEVQTQERDVSARIEAYRETMKANGYNADVAADFLARHAALKDRVRKDVQLLIDRPTTADAIASRNAASNVLHYFPLAYTDDALPNPQRADAIKNIIEILANRERLEGDPNPVQTLRYAIRYMELWAEGVSIPRQQEFFENLILKTGDAAGDVLAKSYPRLEKRFIGNPTFVNAIKGYIIRNASFANVRLIMGAMDATFALPDTFASIDEGAIDQHYGCCAMAEDGFREALLNSADFVLIFVSGELVGLLKDVGENTMLALRNVGNTLRTGFAYGLNQSDVDKALLALRLWSNTTKPAVYRTDSLTVEELRLMNDSDFPELISIALKQYLETGSISELGMEHGAEQLRFLLSAKNSSADAYLESRSSAPSIQKTILAIEQNTEALRSAKSSYKEAEERIAYLTEYLASSERELVELSDTLAKRGLLTKAWITIKKLLRRKDTLPEDIQKKKKSIDGTKEYSLPGAMRNREWAKKQQEGNTLGLHLTALETSGMQFEQLEEQTAEGPEVIERHPAILEVKNNGYRSTVWITFASQKRQVSCDRTMRLAFTGPKATQELARFLQQYNPLVPVEQLLEQYSATLTLEFPLAVQNQDLVPTTQFRNEFRSSLAHDPALFRAERLLGQP